MHIPDALATAAAYAASVADAMVSQIRRSTKGARAWAICAKVKAEPLSTLADSVEVFQEVHYMCTPSAPNCFGRVLFAHLSVDRLRDLQLRQRLGLVALTARGKDPGDSNMANSVAALEMLRNDIPRMGSCKLHTSGMSQTTSA